MLDIKLIRDDLAGVHASLNKRASFEKSDLEKILLLDSDNRNFIKQLEDAQAERNKFSKTKPSPENIAAAKSLGEKIKDLEAKAKNISTELMERLADLPNLPAADVVAGGKENNEVISTYGQMPKFDFIPKDHVELATSLGLIDYSRATKMSGSGFLVLYRIRGPFRMGLVVLFYRFSCPQ